MQWCRFEAEGRASFGVIEDESVTALDGSPWGKHARVGSPRPLASVKLLVPTVPQNFFCVGVNYADHVRKMAEKRGSKPVFPQQPDIGYRSNNALLAHGEDIIKPKNSSAEFQYEGELVAVFGRRARNVSKEEALDYVFGWTIGNDVSERTWQASDRTLWRAKNADTFKPMGPWIVGDLDYRQMRTAIRVNGAMVDEFATGNMIFDVETYISTVSQYCTIEPGDVMWMGTDGVPQNMKPGDEVEIEIGGIGTLRNRIRAEP
jgi:2-keto-4-pentenoate hydratase/2-oxohepta-3-ene-1,7-dioic acid hydratase in catechol pathway